MIPVVRHGASAFRREQFGNWMFCGSILAFELLGVFLARRPVWETGGVADEPTTAPRVLIVADDDTQRLLYRQEFEHQGYAVLEAGDDNEALARLDHDSLDTMVVDTRLLGTDAMRTLERIHHRNPMLPVILDGTAAAIDNPNLGGGVDADLLNASSPEAVKHAAFVAADDARGQS